jgi:hypothetical protein
MAVGVERAMGPLPVPLQTRLRPARSGALYGFLKKNGNMEKIKWKMSVTTESTIFEVRLKLA